MIQKALYTHHPNAVNGVYSCCPGTFFENGAVTLHPLLYPPHREEERIRAFPLDGERLDRGETLWNAFNFHLLWVSVRS